MASLREEAMGADGWTRPDPPVRVARPMLYQVWRDCAFLHWSYPADVLQRHIPPEGGAR